MANTQNFQEVAEIIRKNPGQANSLAIEWEKFIKKSSESSPEILPEILSIKTRGEFSKWTSEHPEKHVDPSIWDGKEISEYYSYLKKQSNQPQSTIDTKTTEANPQEKTEEKSTSISLSDVNRLIKEVSDAEKNLTPKPPTLPTTEPTVRFPVQTNEQMAQRGISGAGRVGSRAAAQAGRAAAQAGRLAAQAGIRAGAALFATPVGWVIIAVGVVVIITFVIVFSVGGGGGSSPAIAPEVSADISPIPTPTPTPAGP